MESSQWTLLDSDNEDCEEQPDSSQASMVGALSILISPIKMITSLVNPEESQESVPDAFNEAVILYSQLEGDDACEGGPECEPDVVALVNADGQRLSIGV